MNKEFDLRPLLTPEEVCEILRITKRSFYKRVWSGQLPVIRLGSSLRVSREQLNTYIYGKGKENKPNGGYVNGL